MQVVVTSNQTNRVLSLKAALTHGLAIAVGNAFTEDYDRANPMHDLLRTVFGEYTFRWFCVDQSDVVYALTFSIAANPRVLEYQGAPAMISMPDRVPLVLRLQDSDLVRPGAVVRIPRRHLIDVEFASK